MQNWSTRVNTLLRITTNIRKTTNFKSISIVAIKKKLDWLLKESVLYLHENF